MPNIQLSKNYNNILRDGNTVGWYDSTDLATITKDASNLISTWSDKLASGRNLTATGSYRPIYSDTNGVMMTNGGKRFLLSATINNPQFIYMVVRRISDLTGLQTVIDGQSAGTMRIDFVGNTQMRMYSVGCVDYAYPTILTIGQWYIVRLYFNGASSFCKIGTTLTNAPTMAAVNVTDIMLGGDSDYSRYSNTEFKEVIIRRITDLTNNETAIYNYLNSKYSVGTSITVIPNIKIGYDYNKILRDGYTIGWYDYTALSTLTLSVDSSVSSWRDKLGSGRNAVQSTTAWQPKWTSTGIRFDSSVKGLEIYVTYNQPFTVYLVVKQYSWIYTKTVICLNLIYGAVLEQGWFTPDIRAYAGGASADSPHRSLTIGTFGIVRAMFNSTQSKLQINTVAAPIENFGTYGIYDIYVGGYPPFGTCADIEIKELIIRRVIDSDAKNSTIYNYLHNKYSLGLQENLSGNKIILSQYTVEAQNLFTRMVNLGEPPVESRKIKIDNCIKALKAQNLFTTQFDVLVVLRGTGELSVRQNWIKNAHNAKLYSGNNVYYMQDIGVKRSASTGYGGFLDTNYKASIHKVNYSLNNASFIIKRSSSSTTSSHGVVGSGNMWFENTSAALNAPTTTDLVVNYSGDGYRALIRSDASIVTNYLNNASDNFYRNSVAVPDYSTYIFVTNNWGTVSGAADVSENVQLYAIGKSLSNVQFQTFQTIMESYFTSL